MPQELHIHSWGSPHLKGHDIIDDIHSSMTYAKGRRKLRHCRGISRGSGTALSPSDNTIADATKPLPAISFNLSLASHRWTQVATVWNGRICQCDQGLGPGRGDTRGLRWWGRCDVGDCARTRRACGDGCQGVLSIHILVTMTSITDLHICYSHSMQQRFACFSRRPHPAPRLSWLS